MPSAYAAKMGSQVLTALAVACVLGAPIASHAQVQPAASAAAPSDRAKHDADKVYQMILQHADKPRRPREEKPGGTSAATPAAPAASAASARAALAARKAKSPAAPSVAAAAGSTLGATAVSAGAGALPTPTAKASEPPPLAAQGDRLAAVAPSSLPQAPVASNAPAPTPLVPKLERIVDVEPDFPPSLMRKLRAGSVVVKFVVLPDGRVDSTSVASSTHSGLNEAAISAVSAWRFKPIEAPANAVTELSFQ